MKWIDLLKTIKATRVSFIALILFISLSIGNLLGTGWSGPAVEILANRYYDDHAVMDFKAMSADSFDQNDVDKIRSLDDVADAEGINTADGFMYINGEKELVSVCRGWPQLCSRLLRWRMLQSISKYTAPVSGQMKLTPVSESIHIDIA